MCENSTDIYECTTGETAEIINGSCLNVEVSVDSKGTKGMALAIWN